MLFPSQAKILAPITRQIGRLGEAPDVHPGVILDLTTTVVNRRDGTSQVVPAAIVALMLTARPENGGHQYLAIPRRNGQPQAIPLEWLWPRAKATADGESLLIPGLDDFASVEAVQAKLQEDNATALKENAFGSGLAAAAEARTPTAKSGKAKDALSV